MISAASPSRRTRVPPARAIASDSADRLWCSHHRLAPPSAQAPPARRSSTNTASTWLASPIASVRGRWSASRRSLRNQTMAVVSSTAPFTFPVAVSPRGIRRSPISMVTSTVETGAGSGDPSSRRRAAQGEAEQPLRAEQERAAAPWGTAGRSAGWRRRGRRYRRRRQAGSCAGYQPRSTAARWRRRASRCMPWDGDGRKAPPGLRRGRRAPGGGSAAGRAHTRLHLRQAARAAAPGHDCRAPRPAAPGCPAAAPARRRPLRAAAPRGGRGSCRQGLPRSPDASAGRAAAAGRA